MKLLVEVEDVIYRIVAMDTHQISLEAIDAENTDPEEQKKTIHPNFFWKHFLSNLIEVFHAQGN